MTNCDGDGWVSADTTDENGNFYFMMNEPASYENLLPPGTTRTKIVN